MDNEIKVPSPEESPKEKRTLRDWLGDIYELVEMLGIVSVTIMLMFAFVLRLNIVDGHSMDMTLAHGEYLAVSDLLYEPEAGDIVIVHKINADPYDAPIVKRVIATEGQTVDIDFATWTLKVDGEVIDEPYRYLDDGPTLTSDWTFPVTVGENEIFVMGDNRNNSADSRTSEIGMIDKRCVVGKAYVRIFPMQNFEVFKNPRKN
ncbi:MAG: signal peptidase I [Clostridia bacterium]|nr:signal peptidase I [Clostridia bacterium]MBQ9994878.1 signal peptidase I [Clostridia bacterium]